jgi:acetyl/propionyl-CoA carboxylase alpha subunit
MGSVGAVTRVGDGVYQVDVDGRTETLYVAGPANDRWVFWNGRVFRGDFRQGRERRPAERTSGNRALTAPMPATVVRIHVKPGDAVTKGQILMLLEAMKMELPIRAPGDGVVSAVHGREGQLVDADAVLVEIT